jgi:hypothetical protein
MIPSPRLAIVAAILFMAIRPASAQMPYPPVTCATPHWNAETCQNRTKGGIAVGKTIYNAYQEVMLPPPEYDRSFNGSLHLYRYSIEGLETRCERKMVACSERHLESCYVYMLHDADLVAMGIDPLDVYRHEMGHCNGWPAINRRDRADIEAELLIRNVDLPYVTVRKEMKALSSAAEAAVRSRLLPASGFAFSIAHLPQFGC